MVLPTRNSIGILSQKMKALTPRFQKVWILFKIEPLEKNSCQQTRSFLKNRSMKLFPLVRTRFQNSPHTKRKPGKFVIFLSHYPINQKTELSRRKLHFRYILDYRKNHSANSPTTGSPSRTFLPCGELLISSDNSLPAVNPCLCSPSFHASTFVTS